MKLKLTTKRYRQEGDMAHEYGPFRTLVKKDNNQVSEFNTDEIDVDLNNPLSIECQQSYDGTVNLIINDDKNPPRIINSRFSRLENNRYKVVNRNQKHQTNLYDEGLIDRQTRLFRNINSIPKFDLINVNQFGQLPGGNYHFYLKLADNDYNKTDIVAESGTVSIFNGTINKPATNHGTLEDENTDKSITMQIKNIDLSFSKYYIYYTRDYSDVNGYRKTKSYFVTKPYEITSDICQFTLTGFESVEEISEEELNIQYNIATNVKTQAQVQNRLFFGNVVQTDAKIVEMQNLSYYISVSLCQSEDSIGWVGYNYKQNYSDDMSQCEYYSPKNIYYKLGYWPDEIYRLGIVYIMNDDSLSPVFNLRGCKFDSVKDSSSEKWKWNNLAGGDSRKEVELKTDNNINYIERDVMLDNSKWLDNTLGVFKNPKISNSHPIQKYSDANPEVKPWYYEIELSKDIQDELRKYKVKGYFIVRQKRIPITICQGLTIGIDQSSYIPMLAKKLDTGEFKYFTESFLNKNLYLSDDFEGHKLETSIKQSSGIISVEASVTPSIQSTLDGSEFLLEEHFKEGSLKQDGRLFNADFVGSDFTNSPSKATAIYVNENVPLKYVNGKGFSTKAGGSEEARLVSFFEKKDIDKADNQKLLRGSYAAFIGTNQNLSNNSIYSIKQKNYSEIFLKDYFTIRGNDQTPFYAISDRYELSDESNTINVYRGDCFTVTTTVRLNRNFVDSDVPVNEIIIDQATWKDNYKGFSKTSSEEWLNINRADLNTVQLGHWVTFKCLASRNIGIRSIDRSYIEEQALMGNPRAFYPVVDATTNTSQKIAESQIQNDGYNAIVNQRRNTIAPNVPYIKDMFENRIMFSNPQANDSFKNNYRVFQGLSYQDIDRQYGAIVKLIPWGNNLFCAFEHGLAIVPVNEKALIQTTTAQNVHMYGAGVLQEQVSVISQDYGSIWQESIIRTPIGIYGVDTYAKKIWCYTQDGLKIISDMKIQSFLNENIKLKEKDKYNTVALRNVKAHYNNYKGDVIFTFYNYTENTEWSICWNERQDLWITRYSWIPLYSANINNIFYSLDKKRAEILAYIFNNKNNSSGVYTVEENANLWLESEDFHTFTLKLSGYTLADKMRVELLGCRTSYINEDNIEQFEQRDANDIFTVSGEGESVSISTNKTSITKAFGFTPKYCLIDIKVTPIIDVEGDNDPEAIAFRDTIGIITEYKPDDKEWDRLLRNGFYVHGRAGIFDEISYTDDDYTNQITPTKWYDKQEPFEFEFVIKDPVGYQKIFNNLVIISNNVEPKSFEFEVIGDSYLFNKARLYNLQKNPNYNKKTLFDAGRWEGVTSMPSNKGFKNAYIKFDHVLNQYTIVMNQDSKNLEEYGRMLGNIHYKEDSFYLTIDPLKYDVRLNNHNLDPKDFDNNTKWNQTRIRDKWIRIRIKYSGEKLAVISAIRTLTTLSYA